MGTLGIFLLQRKWDGLTAKETRFTMALRVVTILLKRLRRQFLLNKILRKKFTIFLSHQNTNSHFSVIAISFCVKITGLLLQTWNDRWTKFAGTSLARRNFLAMHFALMTTNACRIFEAHVANFAFEILPRPMYGTVNV